MKNKVTSTNRWSLSTSGSTRASNVGSYCLRFAICFFWLLVGRPAQAEIKAGDILVVDQLGGTDNLGALILVNPRTGHRSVLSDFGNKDQGDLGHSDLSSVAVGRGGQIYVSALFSGDPAFGGGALFEVDPDTGERKLLSNLSQRNIQGFLYYGLAVNAQGKVIANLTKRVKSTYALVQIDPKTDKRALITDLTNRAQGVTESDRFITDLAIERLGTILIGTARGSGQPDSVIFRVDPVTGKRRLLSDFADAKQRDDVADVADLWFSKGLAIETSGQILAASGGSSAAPRNLLLRIDPNTGKRKVLSDFDNPEQGNLGGSLAGVALEKSGNIIVGASDPSVATFSLFRVQPKTGQRVLLSDSNNPAQGGPSLIGLTYIAVVP
jgi:hypothetical protein